MVKELEVGSVAAAADVVVAVAGNGDPLEVAVVAAEFVVAAKLVVASKPVANVVAAVGAVAVAAVIQGGTAGRALGAFRDTG